MSTTFHPIIHQVQDPVKIGCVLLAITGIQDSFFLLTLTWHILDQGSVHQYSYTDMCIMSCIFTNISIIQSINMSKSSVTASFIYFSKREQNASLYWAASMISSALGSLVLSAADVVGPATSAWVVCSPPLRTDRSPLLKLFLVGTEQWVWWWHSFTVIMPNCCRHFQHTQLDRTTSCSSCRWCWTWPNCPNILYWCHSDACGDLALCGLVIASCLVKCSTEWSSLNQFKTWNDCLSRWILPYIVDVLWPQDVSLILIGWWVMTSSCVLASDWLMFDHMISMWLSCQNKTMVL